MPHISRLSRSGAVLECGRNPLSTFVAEGLTLVIRPAACFKNFRESGRAPRGEPSSQSEGRRAQDQTKEALLEIAVCSIALCTPLPARRIPCPVLRVPNRRSQKPLAERISFSSDFGVR